MDEAVLKEKISRLLIPAALLFPALLMTANLLYDELWSLLFFSPLPLWQILTDLALPNNHPLNTLCIKILSPFSLHPAVLRLPSLICGAFIPLLCGKLAYKWSSKNKLGAMLGAAILAMFSMPLAVYAGQARGYAIQLFCLLLCLWALSSVKEDPKRAAVCCALGGIGAVLSVPTGALFLLPMGIGFLIYSGNAERFDRRMWIAAGAIAIFSGIFYGVNFQALRAGQNWGIAIGSAGGFFDFLASTLASLILVPALLATLPAWISKPRRLIALALLLLPLLLALVSNGGPARTYLYLPAAVAIAGGIGIGEAAAKFPRRELWISGIAAAVLASGGIILQYKAWQPVDYTAVFEAHDDELESDILPVYRASAGFPMCSSLPDALENYQQKVSRMHFRRVAFFETRPGEFNGLDQNQSEAVIQSAVDGTSAEFAGVPCTVYPVSRVDSLVSGGSYLLICRGDLPEELDKKGQWLYLNVWFTQKLKLAVFVCGENAGVPWNVTAYRIGE